MLNEHLYAVLVKHFGEVKISNENVKRVEDRIPGEPRPRIIERGEHYNVCCPCCDDDRFRLSISYKWLTTPPLSNRRITHLIHCYNEECEEIQKDDFREPILEDLDAMRLGLLSPDDIPEAKRQAAAARPRGPIPLPKGFKLLTDLRAHHPAIDFLLDNYPAFKALGRERVVPYLAQGYGVGYCGEYDDMFPLAKGRVIFPIMDHDNRVLAWQGRAVEDDAGPRWYLPPGFQKVWYNACSVSPVDTPILCEGIVNAICCGPKGLAMFGKQINTLMAEDFAKRWSSVLIATDADTFVPDNRKGGGGRVFAHGLRDQLRKAGVEVKMIKWPSDVLDLAKKNNDGTKTKVPDAADLGFKVMRNLIEEAL